MSSPVSSIYIFRIVGAWRIGNGARGKLTTKFQNSGWWDVGKTMSHLSQELEVCLSSLFPLRIPENPVGCDNGEPGNQALC